MSAPSQSNKSLVSTFPLNVAAYKITEDSIEADYEEQKSQQIEVFEKPPLKELELEQKWTMWEHYELANNQTASFED